MKMCTFLLHQKNNSKHKKAKQQQQQKMESESSNKKMMSVATGRDRWPPSNDTDKSERGGRGGG